MTDLSESDFRRAAGALEARRHAFQALRDTLAAQEHAAANGDLEGLEEALAGGADLLDQGRDPNAPIATLLADLTDGATAGPRADALRDLCREVASEASLTRDHLDRVVQTLRAGQQVIARALATLPEDEHSPPPATGPRAGGLVDRVG